MGSLTVKKIDKIEIAREINKALKILGNVSLEKIEEVLEKKYPDFFQDEKEEDKYDNRYVYDYKGYSYVSLDWNYFKIIKSPKSDPMSKGMVFTDSQKVLDYINSLK